MGKPETLEQAREAVAATWAEIVGRPLRDFENADCGDAVATEPAKAGIDAADALAAVVCWGCEESIILGGADDCSDVLREFLTEHRHCTHPTDWSFETPGVGY